MQEKKETITHQGDSPKANLLILWLICLMHKKVKTVVIEIKFRT
jgi:hypothetical protein